MNCNAESLRQLAVQVGDKLTQNQYRFACAESCTGGGIAYYSTAVPGASRWFEGGVVTYSNSMKQALLQVRAETLAEHGAVSDATVREMVHGVMQRFPVHVALASSGIAGPGGGCREKPVGTVFLAWQMPDRETLVERYCFRGDREQIRQQAVQASFVKILSVLS
jgi:nicotinamide-nucleotide amidase